MRSAFLIVLTSLIALVHSTPTQACFGHRGRCSGSHPHRRAMVVASPPRSLSAVTYPSSQMISAPASPQMISVPPVPAGVSLVGAPTPAAAAVPTYEYSAVGTGQPAYYYTYDNSGKLIVARWMDWVFRGGAAAGEPAPPLPIIGALRGR